MTFSTIHYEKTKKNYISDDFYLTFNKEKFVTIKILFVIYVLVRQIRTNHLDTNKEI